MLTIRLKRKGKKNQPFFRVVVTDKKRAAKGGRAVEDVGYVDPLTKRKSLNKERVLHWIKMGAKPSDTIHNMLVSEKIIEGKKIHVAKKSKKPVETTTPTLTSTPSGTVVETKIEEVPAEVKAKVAIETPAEEIKLAEPEKIE